MGMEPQAARPLSGEILLSPVRPAGGVRPEGAIDADYVTLDPPLPEHRPRHVAPPAGAAGPVAGMAMLRKDAAIPTAARWSRAGVPFWLFGLALVAASFWISGGHALVSR